MSFCLLLAQEDRFALWRQAVEEQFRSGGTFTSAFLAIFGLIVLVVGAAWLSERQRRKMDQIDDLRDPLRLYMSLVTRLDLLPPQRNLLTRIGKELKLPQPAAILLSETQYDGRTAEWLEKHGPTDSSALKSDVEVLVKARAKLFPNRAAGVIGGPSRTSD